VRYDLVKTLAGVVTILIHGRDQRDLPIVFDDVHVTLGCISEIMAG